MVKVQKSKFNVRSFVIGVDGGGTKTAAALADMDGKIIKKAVAGGSSVRNFGIKIAAKNVAQAVYGVLKGKRNIRIVSTFIGLPAMEEEYKDKRTEIVKELKKHKKIATILRGKIEIGSDQLVAFRSGSHGRDGILAICGTGTAIHGWNGKKEFLTNNRGWLLSKGSANWIGRHAALAIVEKKDDRGGQTILDDSVFKKLKFKNINDLSKFVYQDPTGNLPKLAVLCDEAANRGDKVAQEILKQAGREIALAVRVAAAKLQLAEQVPLVLVGGVYKSRWMADAAVSEIERYYPGKFDIVFVDDPAAGAVKLALENTRKI